jgi:hypothetical protein
MPGGAKSVPVRSLIVEGGYYLTATQQLNSSLAWDLTELAQNSISAALLACRLQLSVDKNTQPANPFQA